MTVLYDSRGPKRDYGPGSAYIPTATDLLDTRPSAGVERWLPRNETCPGAGTVGTFGTAGVDCAAIASTRFPGRSGSRGAHE